MSFISGHSRTHRGTRRALLLSFSIVFVVSATWWGSYAYKTRAISALTVGNTSEWSDNVPSDADLFTLISSKADHKNFYELSNYDQMLYKRIFDAQNQGAWAQANTLMRRVHNPVLMGHVLFDRYIRADDYKATYPELRAWMKSYGDHPDAYKVYQLAQKRRNNDPAELPAPQIAKKLFGSLELSWFKAEEKAQNVYKPKHRDQAQVRNLMAQIKQRLANDKVTSAYSLLGQSKISHMLTNIEYDALLGEIAAGYYYNGKYDVALKTAQQATKRSDKAVPVAHWIGGLAAWQQGDFNASAKHFEAISNSHSRNPWMLSAAAFWAARANLKLGRRDEGNDWLHEAASYPRTFYGLVALAKLGEDTTDDFSWDEPPLTDNLLGALKKDAAAQRALALLDIGQNALAEAEFRQVHPNGNKRLEKALVAAAGHFKLSSLALSLGNAINKSDGHLYDVALYPVVPWKGDETTGVDSALINALIRQESKFDANAQNGRSGAKGLMQLMPRTAKFMSDASFHAKDMHKPEVNVALGQRYVRYLLDMEQINGNMIYLAAAYNAGPGNLARWKKTIAYNDDPFLFIESLPLSETRAFIERVLTNYWVYRERFGQETPTLTSLGNGEWPVYKPDADAIKMAAYKF